MRAKSDKGRRFSANSGKLDNPVTVAQIVKSYRTNGEVVVKLTNDLLEDLDRKEPVFIYFDELPVPFFIEEFNFKGNSGAVVKFTTVNDLSASEELVRRKIWVESASVDAEAMEELAQEDMGAYLRGFILYDAEDDEIGEISDYYDYPNNPCIELIPVDGVKSLLAASEDESEPILLPFQEEFILAFDPEERVIRMDIPKGLIEKSEIK